MARSIPKSKDIATKDRHLQRTTAYRPATSKKSGSGKWNWGTEADHYTHDVDYPVGEPFEDALYEIAPPAADENHKIKVKSV